MSIITKLFGTKSEREVKKMLPRKRISLKRRLMYIAFYLVPSSSVIMGKILGLRK